MSPAKQATNGTPSFPAGLRLLAPATLCLAGFAAPLPTTCRGGHGSGGATAGGGRP